MGSYEGMLATGPGGAVRCDGPSSSLVGCYAGVLLRSNDGDSVGDVLTGS